MAHEFQPPSEAVQLRRLQFMSLFEATTLMLLVGVAVPLKHLAGHPLPVSIMGPIHGLAFLAYAWTVLQTVSGASWTRAEVARVLIAAFVPMAGFANLRFLAAKRQQLT